VQRTVDGGINQRNHGHENHLSKIRRLAAVGGACLWRRGDEGGQRLIISSDGESAM